MTADDPTLPYGFVTGRFVVAVGDTTSDVDTTPDIIAAQGSVMISPVSPVYLTDSPIPTTTIAAAITLSIDSSGYIRDPAGRKGVWLIAGQYNVDYQFQGVTLPSFTIDVTTAHTEAAPLDLTLAAPLIPTPATKFVVNEQVYLDTLAARDAAQSYAVENDAAVATYIAAEDTATAAAVGDRISATFNGFGDFHAKMRQQQQDVNILLVGDSTLDLTNVGSPAGSACSWALGLAAQIGTMFPTHTVEQRRLNLSADANTWDAATSVQVGTGYRADLAGPKKLTVWVAGWSGHNWPDFFDSKRRNAIFVTPNADTIVIAFGHNDPDAPNDSIRGRVSVLCERARTLNPRAQLILSSQNPRSLTPGRAEARNDIYRSLARERGWGYINVTQAFYDDGRSLATGGPLIDSLGVHPTTDGAAIWQGVVLDQIKSASHVAPIPTSPVMLTVAGRALTPPLEEWVRVNVTHDVSGTVTDGGGPVTYATKTVGNTPSYYEAELPIEQLRGQEVTFHGRFHLPTGAHGSAGQFQFRGPALISYTIAEYSVRDDWFDVSVSAKVDPAAAGPLVARVLVDPTSDPSTPSMYISTAAVFAGSAPLAVAPRPVDPVAMKKTTLQAMAVVSAKSTVTNYAVNASAERAVNTLVPLTTGGIIKRSTDVAASGGSWSFKCVSHPTVVQADVFGIDTVFAAAAAPSEDWVASAWFFNATSGTRNFRAGLRFLDASGAVLGSSYGTGTIAAGASGRVSYTTTAPASTAKVIAMVVRVENSGATAGDIWYVDDLILAKGTTPPAAPANADTDPLYYYSGALGISSSVGIVP